MSVVAGSLPLHTDDMTGDARATAFVTGAAGFIGTELVKVLIARGRQVRSGAVRGRCGARASCRGGTRDRRPALTGSVARRGGG